MTVLHLLPVQERLDAADSGRADQLWDALYAARTDRRLRSVAELEDAAFSIYLPLARSAASLVYGESAEATNSAQQAAELGLAQAILVATSEQQRVPEVRPVRDHPADLRPELSRGDGEHPEIAEHGGADFRSDQPERANSLLWRGGFGGLRLLRIPAVETSVRLLSDGVVNAAGR